MSDGIAPFRLPDGEAPFPYSFRGEGHILGRRQELQDGGLYDRLDDAASAGDARRSMAEGPPLADPPRAADRLMTPESSVDDLGSLEVRQPLQLLRRRSPRALSLTHPHSLGARTTAC
jgi:hypothetical protein